MSPPTLSIRILLLPPSELPPLHFHASLLTFHTLNFSPPAFYSVPWARHPLPPDRDTTDNTLCHRLDLHRLYVLVRSLGGFDNVKVAQWEAIAAAVNEPGTPPLEPEEAAALYELHLLEYEVFANLVCAQFRLRGQEKEMEALMAGIASGLQRASDRLVWRDVDRRKMLEIPETMLMSHLPPHLRDVAEREKVIRREVSGSELGVYPYTRADDEGREEIEVGVVERVEEVMNRNREEGMGGRFTPEPRLEELRGFLEDEASTIKGSARDSVSVEESLPALGEELGRWGLPDAHRELVEKYGFQDCSGRSARDDDESSASGFSFDFADYSLMVGGPKSKKMMEWWKTRLQFEGGLWEPTVFFADHVRFDDTVHEEEESEKSVHEEKMSRFRKWKQYLGHRWKFGINVPKATGPVSMRMLSHRKGRDKGHASDESSTDSDSVLSWTNDVPISGGKDTLGRSLHSNLMFGKLTEDASDKGSSWSSLPEGIDGNTNTRSTDEKCDDYQIQRFPTVSDGSLETYASTSDDSQNLNERPSHTETHWACDTGDIQTSSEGSPAGNLGFYHSGGNNGRPPTRGRGPNDKEAKEAADAAWRAGARYFEHNNNPKDNPQASRSESEWSWSFSNSDAGTTEAVAMAGLQERPRSIPSRLALMPKQRLPIPSPMRRGTGESDTRTPIRAAQASPSPNTIAKKDADIQDLVNRYRTPQAPPESDSGSSYRPSSMIETWADKVENFKNRPAEFCQWQNPMAGAPHGYLPPPPGLGSSPHRQPSPPSNLNPKQRREFNAIHDRLSVERAENNKLYRGDWKENVSAHRDSQQSMLDLVRHGSKQTRPSSSTRLNPFDSFAVQQAQQVRDRRRKVSDVIRAKAEQKKKEQRELYHRPKTNRREVLSRLSPEMQEAERRGAEERTALGPRGYGMDEQHDRSSSTRFDSIGTMGAGVNVQPVTVETTTRNGPHEAPDAKHRQFAGNQNRTGNESAHPTTSHHKPTSPMAALEASYPVQRETSHHGGTTQQGFHGQHEALRHERPHGPQNLSSTPDRSSHHSRNNTVHTMGNDNNYAVSNGVQLGHSSGMDPLHHPTSGNGHARAASTASTTVSQPVTEPINPGLYQAVSCLEPDGRLGHRLIPVPLNVLSTTGSEQYLNNQALHIQQQQTVLQQLQQLQPLLAALQGINLGQPQQQFGYPQSSQQSYMQPQQQSGFGNRVGGAQSLDLASALALLGGLGGQRLELGNQHAQFNQPLQQQVTFAQQNMGIQGQMQNMAGRFDGNGISMSQEENPRSISGDFQHPANAIPDSLRTAHPSSIGRTNTLNPLAPPYHPPASHANGPREHAHHRDHRTTEPHNWTPEETATVTRLLDLCYHRRFPLLRTDPSALHILNNLNTPTPSFTAAELTFFRSNWPRIIQLATTHNPAPAPREPRKFDPSHRLNTLEPEHRNLQPIEEVDPNNVNELFLLSHYLNVCRHKRYPVKGQHLVHPAVVDGLGLAERQMHVLVRSALRGWCLHPPRGVFEDGEGGVEVRVHRE